MRSGSCCARLLRRGMLRLVLLFENPSNDGRSGETFGFGLLIDHAHKRSGELEDYDNIVTLSAN